MSFLSVLLETKIFLRACCKIRSGKAASREETCNRRHPSAKKAAMAVRLPLLQKKAPDPIDRHVGSRVRMRRIMLAMRQEHLADALGVSYQQVQKNEKGT